MSDRRSFLAACGLGFLGSLFGCKARAAANPAWSAGRIAIKAMLGTAGANLKAGQAVYLGSDGKFWPCPMNELATLDPRKGPTGERITITLDDKGAPIKLEDTLITVIKVEEGDRLSPEQQRRWDAATKEHSRTVLEMLRSRLGVPVEQLRFDDPMPPPPSPGA